MSNAVEDTTDCETDVCNSKLAGQYATFVLKFRWVIIIALVASTLMFATQIPKLDVRNDPDTLLPPTNRYVATNLYAEHNFGMGNIMVFALKVKEGDIWQPWFINKLQKLHRDLEQLPYPRKENFIDIAAQKIKYMSTDENGLVFKRLIPTEGISDDPEKAREQLAFLREGVKTNPIMAPMLVSMWDADGNQCAYEDYDQDRCIAKAAYILADYADEVKEVYLPWVEEVRALIDEYGEDDRIEVLAAGEPYFLAWMLADLIHKWWLFVISIAITILVLWLQFRNWQGALLPIMGVFMTITFTLGLMGFSEFKLTTMMVLTPMLLLAIGIGHSVQVTRRFLLEYEKTDDRMHSAHVAIGHTMVPATLSIVTDMVGFATLATVDISFYKAYAYFGMFGMLTLLMTTTTMIPLMLSIFPPKTKHLSKEEKERDWTSVMGGILIKMIVGPGKIIPLGVVVLVMVVSGYYTNIMNWKGDPAAELRLQNDGDIMPGVEKGINYARAAFKGSSDIWEDLVKLNEIMPGVISVSIPIRGKEPLTEECLDEDDEGNLIPPGCWDPDEMGAQGIFNDALVHRDIELMEDWMRDHKFIGFTGSYVQYIRLINMLLLTESGDKPNIDDLIIPNPEYLVASGQDEAGTPDEIVQMYNGLLEALTAPGEMDSFVNTDTWNEGVVLGFINTMNPRETHQVTMDLMDYIEEHKDDPGFRKVNFGLRSGPVENLSGDTNELADVNSADYTRPAVGGFLGATEATREVAMDTWLTGPIQTALAIFIITALMFRSFLVAGILTITLFITLFAQYGLGGYFTSVGEWSGNLAFHLLVTLSIAMGLGVDYGIYMISRLKEEMAETGGNWAESLRNTLDTTGSAVIVSIVVLLGSFVPLVGTDLANTWGLSIFIAEALIVDVFTALMLLPMMVYWLKPKYVFES